MSKTDLLATPPQTAPTSRGQATGRLLSAVALAATLLSLTGISNAKALFTINTADKPPYSTESNTGFYDRIILRTFENLGMKIKINHLPSARSIENADVGLDDAEYARIKDLSDRYENLRIVDEKLVDFAFTAFAKDPSISINGWESLKGHDVAFMRGWKIYERNVNQAKSFLVVSSEEELFQLLVNDRVDIVLYERLRGFNFMRKRGIQGIMNLSNPLSVRGMYLYVNRKHDGLIPDIERSLKAIKASGEYKDILKSYLD